MKMPKSIFFHLFSMVDQALKFPQLKKGETGIQVGFDMNSATTSDLFEMSRRVGKNGMVIGIDPDEWNHEIAKALIKKQNYSNIKLVQCGTFSEVTKATFLFGKKASWSQLGNIPIDETVDFSGRKTEIQLETLDNIINKLNIDVKRIGHVNITNNGAEYFTLKGFEKGLSSASNLALTVIAGRYDSSGIIDGKPDYEVILEYLASLGFKTKFKRIHQNFWWGFCVKLIINRQWVFNRKNYGVIFATKGKKRIPFYQSFS